jgi:virulence-associated protein VapD
MFALSFDLDVAEAHKRHPKGSREAYRDIEKTLGLFGFERVQWSVYAADTDDLGKLVLAILALRDLLWLGPSLKDLKGFQNRQGVRFHRDREGQHAHLTGAKAN